eukprot:TRINITY_DN9057_c0_g1_i1.p1 TRINITY_DN9057_c0_g1~~TRINITY_DN9057_c0_g1_i1.p1  ORF type:complete len:231 (+),score=49.41 TRINITY_DN9057_c0_g1_i1:679-1371(+)
MPSLVSTLRVAYSSGRLSLEVDQRNTQGWHQCVNTQRVSTVIPEAVNRWRKEATVGIVAVTGVKQARFEVSTFSIYNKASDAVELSRPDWNGDEGDMALRVAHQLEHSLFQVKDSIERMLSKLSERAQEDATRIRRLEHKVSDGALSFMDKRLAEVEKRLTTLSTPIVEARVRQVEARANHKLEMFKWQTNREANTWLRPFALVLFMLTAFAIYSYREFRAMSKWNRNFM